MSFQIINGLVRHKKIFLLRFVGNILIFSSIMIVVKTFATPLYAEFGYFVDTVVIGKKYVVFEGFGDGKGSGFIPQVDDKNKNPYDTSHRSQLGSFFGLSSSESIVPIDPASSIVIPKIAANARIIQNVSATDERVYLESLKDGVAHASGTKLPGEGGNIFLFAHSTDYVWNISTYNALFYLLYKLEKDDEIDVFYEGKRYVYLVSEKKVVLPDQVGYLVNSTQTEQLTLQTCWPPGTTFQRLIVIAKRKAI